MQTRGSGKRALGSLGVLLIPFLVGCGDQGAKGNVTPPPGGPEHISEIGNPFPSDHGIVPQDRGLDLRGCLFAKNLADCLKAPKGTRGDFKPIIDKVGVLRPKLPKPDPNPNPDPDPDPDPNQTDPDPDPDQTDPDPNQPDPDPVEPGTPGLQARTLVLYDSTGPYGWLGELYGILAANLSSHFGDWSAKPVGEYQTGDASRHEAVIYIGSTYEEPLPISFLDDVLEGSTNIVWMYNNIWQLANRSPDFMGTYGFNPWSYDFTPISEVVYKGVKLSRYEPQGSGIMSYNTVDTSKAEIVASAVRADNSTFPWALRAKNLTYIGEIPFSYITSNDRYLAFSDMLFDVLDPQRPERHRALLRLEDVSPAEDPNTLRAIADYLGGQNIPFSIAVIPVYVDPRGVYNDGIPVTKRLSGTPEMVSALKYMVERGGRIVMHGYTHQYSNIDNPYNGVSADDTEFYLMHVDELDYVIYDGPIDEDSEAWVNSRIGAGLLELQSAGFGRPSIFEYPHYAGSHLDSLTISRSFDTAYHRGLYFGGTLRGGMPDYKHIIGQFFPYVVRDIYGWKIIPENLGNYEPEAMNHHPERLVPDLIHTAKVNRVVRDGVASFFYHPYYGLPILRQIVEGVRGEGYTFVAPEDL